MMQSGGQYGTKDIIVNSPPTEGISSIRFSPKSDLLCCASWDNQVRCWEVQTQSGNTVPKMCYPHDGPVLCVGWSGDGTKLFSGSCDCKAKMFNVQTGGNQVVAQHSAPIKELSYIDELQTLVTGSWDKTLKYWDTRTFNPVCNVQLPERLFAMDVKFPLAVVGTAERHILVYDLQKPNVEFKRINSPLKFQTRCASCFTTKNGFALGSIEGRVAIQYVDDGELSKNFAFKCHRENQEIYAINSISFHPQYGTFATAGADGAFNFWDKESKQRLKTFPKVGQPISSSCFNMNGSIFAYAASYDWSKGSEFYNPATHKSQIYLHSVTEQEIKPRPPPRGRGGRR